MSSEQILQSAAKELSKRLHTDVEISDLRNLYAAGNDVNDVIAKYFASLHQVFG